MSLEQNTDLISEVEMHLEEAEQDAALSDTRFTAGEVFDKVRSRIHGQASIKEIDHETV